jgi:hypothetical protein
LIAKRRTTIAVEMLEVQLNQPRILEIRSEVVLGSRRLAAHLHYSAPNLYGKLSDMLRIPAMLASEATTWICWAY